MDKPTRKPDRRAICSPSRTPSSFCATRCGRSGSLSNTPRPSCCCGTGVSARPSSCSAARASLRQSGPKLPPRRQELSRTERLAERLQRQARYYRTARDFGRIASERGGASAPKNRWRDNVIATGGGPGIMEAANRGAPTPARRASASTSRCPRSRTPTPTSPPSSPSASTTSPCARCIWRCAPTRWRLPRRLRHPGRIV